MMKKVKVTPKTGFFRTSLSNVLKVSLKEVLLEFSVVQLRHNYINVILLYQSVLIIIHNTFHVNYNHCPVVCASLGVGLAYTIIAAPIKLICLVSMEEKSEWMGLVEKNDGQLLFSPLSNAIKTKVCDFNNG